MATKHTDSCLQKAADDEPIFVLRAQDESAAQTVVLWIARNLETAPEEKLLEAFHHALKMKAWSNRKTAD